MYYINTVLIEVYLLYFTESAIVRELGKPTLHAEKSRPNSLYLKAVKGAPLGSALLNPKFWKSVLLKV